MIIDGDFLRASVRAAGVEADEKALERLQDYAEYLVEYN